MSLAVSKVKPGRSPLHGWGVFALVDVSAGDVLEESPVLLVPLDEWEQVPSLQHFVFEWDECSVAVALGSASLYNHGFVPSAVVTLDAERGTVVVTAVSDIEAGCEVLIEYAPVEMIDLWGIVPPSAVLM